MVEGGRMAHELWNKQQQTFRFKWNIMWIRKGEAWKERSSWVRSFMIDILLILSNFCFDFFTFSSWIVRFDCCASLGLLLVDDSDTLRLYPKKSCSGFGCQRVSIFFSILMEKPFVAVHEMLPPTHCFIHQISTCVYTHNTDVRWWLELLKIIDSQKWR